MQTKAQLVRFLLWGTPGVLEYDYENEKVTFATEDNERLLNMPIKGISNVRPSWVGRGTILVFRVWGKQYGFRMTDVPPAASATPKGDLAKQDVDAAREFSPIDGAKTLVKQWCQILRNAVNCRPAK